MVLISPFRGARRTEGVVQAEQAAVGVEHPVGALPELAGLPQAAGLRVADRGDRHPGDGGEFRLGQACRAAAGGQRCRQRAAGGVVVATGLLFRPGHPGPGADARPGHEHAVVDQHPQRPAAGQGGEPGGAGEGGAARRGLAGQERAVGNVSTNGGGDAGVLRQAGTGHGGNDRLSAEGGDGWTTGHARALLRTMLLAYGRLFAIYSTLLLPEAGAADQHGRASRIDFGPPPSAIRPSVPGQEGAESTDRYGRRGRERCADRPQERYADRSAPPPDC